MVVWSRVTSKTEQPRPEQRAECTSWLCRLPQRPQRAWPPQQSLAGWCVSLQPCASKEVASTYHGSQSWGLCSPARNTCSGGAWTCSF